MTGLVFVSGDRHTPQIMIKSKDPASVYYDAAMSIDHVEICACPVGNDTNNKSNGDIFSLSAQTPWGTERDIRVIGVLTFERNYVDIRLVSVFGTEWSGRVYAGNNALSYPETKVAIS